WVEAVTLLLLAGLAALAIWIARLNHPDQNQYDIFFKQSVDGVAKGSVVSFSGVPAGQVAEIALWEQDPGFVRVRIKIDRKVPILMGTTASL
ncbi:MlaD family protein, partial [Vibrio parahaemolyticus]